jgi:hypothetical protein
MQGRWTRIIRIASSIVGFAGLIYLVAHIAKITSPHDRLMEAMRIAVTAIFSVFLVPLKEIDPETSIAERRLIAFLRTAIFAISSIGFVWVIWSVGTMFGTKNWRIALVLLVMAVNIGLIFYNSRSISRQPFKDDGENHGRI